MNSEASTGQLTVGLIRATMDKMYDESWMPSPWDRYVAERLKEPEFRKAYTVALREAAKALYGEEQ